VYVPPGSAGAGPGAAGLLPGAGIYPAGGYGGAAGTQTGALGAGGYGAGGYGAYGAYGGAGRFYPVAGGLKPAKSGPGAGGTGTGLPGLVIPQTGVQGLGPGGVGPGGKAAKAGKAPVPGGRGYGPLQQGVFHGYPLKSPKAPGGRFFYQTLQTMLSLALPRLEKKHLPTDYVCGFTAIKQYNVSMGVHKMKLCAVSTPTGLGYPTLVGNFHTVMVVLVEVLDSLVGKEELAPSRVIQQELVLELVLVGLELFRVVLVDFTLVQEVLVLVLLVLVVYQVQVDSFLGQGVQEQFLAGLGLVLVALGLCQELEGSILEREVLLLLKQKLLNTVWVGQLELVLYLVSEDCTLELEEEQEGPVLSQATVLLLGSEEFLELCLGLEG
ncbi:hypothetical protein cypCar_00028398, partial [Cyprinus carpio]